MLFGPVESFKINRNDSPAPGFPFNQTVGAVLFVRSNQLLMFGCSKIHRPVSGISCLAAENATWSASASAAESQFMTAIVFELFCSSSKAAKAVSDRSWASRASWICSRVAVFSINSRWRMRSFRTGAKLSWKFFHEAVKICFHAATNQWGVLQPGSRNTLGSENTRQARRWNFKISSYIQTKTFFMCSVSVNIDWYLSSNGKFSAICLYASSRTSNALFKLLAV